MKRNKAKAYSLARFLLCYSPGCHRHRGALGRAQGIKSSMAPTSANLMPGGGFFHELSGSCAVCYWLSFFCSGLWVQSIKLQRRSPQKKQHLWSQSLLCPSPGNPLLPTRTSTSHNIYHAYTLQNKASGMAQKAAYQQ